MPTWTFANVFEVDFEIQRTDAVRVDVYFVIPARIPGSGRRHIGGETLSPEQLSRTFSIDHSIGDSGVVASATLTLDIAASAVVFSGKAEIKLFGHDIGGSPWVLSETETFEWPKAPIRQCGNGQIAHVVVVMLENRSFDNLLGWLYADAGNRPPVNLPPQNPPTYDGLTDGAYTNPRDPAMPTGARVQVKRGTSSLTVPSEDPSEQFRHMNCQIFGTESPRPDQEATMDGFLFDYSNTLRSENNTTVDPATIMETYTPAQVPAISALARNYAVCDRWFASVPCQTWPNRAFVHAGTSCGRVNNLDKEPDDNTPPDPLHYNTKTIFNVLHELGVTWKVYADNTIPGTPTLTRYEFLTQLASPLLAGHFRGFGDFQKDAADGTLPSYSFIEPSFLERKNDQHPPHDVSAGDHFLYEIWKAVSQGPGWDHTLLIITYDEHGGCFDHVKPPRTAVRPDSSPPQQPFAFDRYGVRVPAVVVSPWIEAGTVFRAVQGEAEYDHTSILATLRDWQDLANKAGANWLGSARIAKAPTLMKLLTRTSPRTVLPVVDEPQLSAAAAAPPMDISLTGHQRTLLAAALRLAPAGLENDAAVTAGRLANLTTGAAISEVKTLLASSKRRAVGSGN